MTDDRLRVEDAVHDDEIALLDAGSTSVSNPEMFYWLNGGAYDASKESQWSQSIPAEMSRAEGEYQALNRGLRETAKKGYRKVIITTNSVPILDHIREGDTPPAELEPFYETAIQLMDQFDQMEMIAYAVGETRPSE